MWNQGDDEICRESHGGSEILSGRKTPLYSEKAVRRLRSVYGIPKPPPPRCRRGNCRKGGEWSPEFPAASHLLLDSGGNTSPQSAPRAPGGHDMRLVFPQRWRRLVS